MGTTRNGSGGRVSLNQEISSTGLRQYGGRVHEELLPKLRGRQGVRTYTAMRENDAAIGAYLYGIEALIRQVPWWTEPASADAEDQRAAEHVEQCREDMSQTWADVVSEVLSMLQYGWIVLELVYKLRQGPNEDGSLNSKYDDGYVGWRKWPAVGHDTLDRWEFGEGTSIRGLYQSVAGQPGGVFLPIEKSLLFRTQVRKNNPEGRSVLRSAYRSWYFKRRVEEIEAIGVERDLAGMPKLIGPEKVNIFDPDDPKMVILRLEAERIVRGVRRDEMEGVLLNHGWEFELTSTGGQRQLDVDKIINRYGRDMFMTVLADVFRIGNEKVGSYSLADVKTNNLAISLGAILDTAAEVINRYAVTRLIRLNPFSVEAMPEVRHGDVGKRDLEGLANYLQKMVSIGAITLNPQDEDFLREQGGLPPRPEDADDLAEVEDDEDLDRDLDDDDTGGLDPGELKTAGAS